jgi:hypothetical protein
VTEQKCIYTLIMWPFEALSDDLFVTLQRMLIVYSFIGCLNQEGAFRFNQSNRNALTSSGFSC